jgi:hypothetical protein
METFQVRTSSVWASDGSHGKVRCGGAENRVNFVRNTRSALNRKKKVRTGRDFWTDLRNRQNILIVATSISLAIKINNIISEGRGSTGDENCHSLLLPKCTASQLQTSVTFKQSFIHRLTEMNNLAEWLIKITCQHDYRKDDVGVTELFKDSPMQSYPRPCHCIMQSAQPNCFP